MAEDQMDGEIWKTKASLTRFFLAFFWETYKNAPCWCVYQSTPCTLPSPTPPGSISVIGKWCGSFYTYHFYCQVSYYYYTILLLTAAVVLLCSTTSIQPFKLMKRVVEILLRRRPSSLSYHEKKRGTTGGKKRTKKKKARRSVSISKQPSKEYI